MSYMQLGAIDTKLKSTVLKVTDKLGITKYAEQLFSSDGDGTAGIPESAPPPVVAPEHETPWLLYGLTAAGAFLLWKAIAR